MAEKLNITTTLEASGITRDGIKFHAVKTGPVEETDKMQRQIEDMFHRSDAKPIEDQEGGEKKTELP